MACDGLVCQAALPAHWIESAQTPAERARRRTALERLAVVRPDGIRVMDGPAVLDLIRRWDRAFEWVPSKDAGIAVYKPGRGLVEESALARRLLTP